ncbi:TPA: hypothetical protein SMN88_000597 [Pseudomonas aeruginosa]|nr:hypothetical protein [Pseudomonas aeruginosa]
MNKANECTCPSGDGSLVHPCPAHPAVEQAGGDERAACNLWIAEQQLCQGSDISLFKLERNGALVSLHDLLRDAYQAGQARAALGKPSQDVPYADGIAADLERSDWTPEDALRWYAAGKHFDTTNGRTRIIDTGAVASNALKHLSLPYLEMKGDAELTELREAMAQPSPAPELELLRSALSHIIKTCGQSRTETRRLRWIAQRAQWALDGKPYDISAFDLPKYSATAKERLEREVKVLREYARGLPAPVAQAQHSVPDVCDSKEQNAFEEWASKEGMNMERHPLHWLFLDAKTYSARQGWKAALKYARNMLAAAPVCRLSRSALTEAQMRRLYENSTETENERLGFEAFARLIRRAEAVHQIAAAPGKEVPQAWLDVQAERRRQVEAEGWTPEHDDEHDSGELAAAGAAYALHAADHLNPYSQGDGGDEAPSCWPWHDGIAGRGEGPEKTEPAWWKPSTPRRDLVKACALALAEIERLDRAGISQSPQPGATTASS